jgi:hypothetical protein
LKLSCGGRFLFKDVDTGVESELELPARECRYFTAIEDIFRTENCSAYFWKRGVDWQESPKGSQTFQLVLLPNYVFVVESNDGEQHSNTVDEESLRHELVALVTTQANTDAAQRVKRTRSEFMVNLVRVVTREVYSSRWKCPRNKQFYFDKVKPVSVNEANVSDENKSEKSEIDENDYECRIFLNEQMCLLDV